MPVLAHTRTSHHRSLPSRWRGARCADIRDWVEKLRSRHRSEHRRPERRRPHL